MANWARVENGIVMEIISFNPTGCFTDEIVAQFVQVPDNQTVQQGWTYANSTFVASPGPTLEEAQQAKLAQINDLYNQKLDEGFTSSASGTALTFGYAQTDRDKFAQLALKILLKGTMVFPVMVHPKDGSSVTFDQAQYTQLVDDIDAFAEPLDAKQHDYIIQVNACTSVSQVNDITIQF